MTVKLIVMMKRKAGLSREEFIARYEGRYVPFADAYLRHALRYERRYLSPLPGSDGQQAEDADCFDVVTELWYADERAMTSDLRHHGSPAVAAAIAADEEDLLDRATRRSYFVAQEAGGPTG